MTNTKFVFLNSSKFILLNIDNIIFGFHFLLSFIDFILIAPLLDIYLPFCSLVNNNTLFSYAKRASIVACYFV